MNIILIYLFSVNNYNICYLKNKYEKLNLRHLDYGQDNGLDKEGCLFS